MVKSKQSKQRAWTKEEVRLLRALAKQKITAASIARTLNRSLESTKKKASRLGIPLGKVRRWTEDDLRRLKALAKKRQPLTRIARTLHRTVFAVERVASINGISPDFRK